MRTYSVFHGEIGLLSLVYQWAKRILPAIILAEKLKLNSFLTVFLGSRIKEAFQDPSAYIAIEPLFDVSLFENLRFSISFLNYRLIDVAM